jgi:hypothetical protein
MPDTRAIRVARLYTDDFGESGFASLNSPARVTYTQRFTKNLRNARPKSQKIHNLRCATKANQRKFVGRVRDNSRPIQPESVPPGAGPGCPCNCFTSISLVLPSRCGLIGPRRVNATWPQNTPAAKRKIVKEEIISEPYPISQRSPRLRLPEDVGRESDDKCNDTCCCGEGASRR